MERISIIPYSAKKNNVKPAPPYSILNPETSSLSPSDKSKGARLVSAKITTININRNIDKKIPEGKKIDFIAKAS